MFADDELRLDDQFGDDRFNSKNWTGLGASEKQVFWDYVMPVEFLTFDANDPREVNHAFDRLNRNMRKLEPQELRHARWDGWFIKFIDSQCEDLVWKQVGVVNSTRSKRMKDAQFLSELFLVVIDKKSNGFDQQRLDDAYGKYDEIDQLPDDLRRLAQNFEELRRKFSLSSDELWSALDDATEKGNGAKTLNLSPYTALLEAIVSKHGTRVFERLNTRDRIFVPSEVELGELTDKAKSKLVRPIV